MFYIIFAGLLVIKVLLFVARREWLECNLLSLLFVLFAVKVFILIRIWCQIKQGVRRSALVCVDLKTLSAIQIRLNYLARNVLRPSKLRLEMFRVYWLLFFLYFFLTTSLIELIRIFPLVSFVSLLFLFSCCYCWHSRCFRCRLTRVSGGVYIVGEDDEGVSIMRGNTLLSCK